MLTATANKKKNINCIVVDFELHKDDFIPCSDFLIVTCNDAVPMHNEQGNVIRRQDMRIIQEKNGYHSD